MAVYMWLVYVGGITLLGMITRGTSANAGSYNHEKLLSFWRNSHEQVSRVVSRGNDEILVPYLASRRYKYFSFIIA
ncbi:hypothetical protein F5Y16DRAFT_391217 [Xylariaceae sp. FL0255]|nr:hypothetical protein F5Y16DRAFT_391217 [Xylariaceae sp. FL0255]